MGIIKAASNNSTWRGLDYYKAKKVISYKKINKNEYKGIVVGSDNKKYNVFMNIEHPRSSTCDCPHANGKRIICKHIVALYFTVFPSEVDKFLKEVEEAQKEYEVYEQELYKKVIKHINSMTKEELKESLIDILNVAPEWVYDRFVRDKIEY